MNCIALLAGPGPELSQWTKQTFTLYSDVRRVLRTEGVEMSEQNKILQDKQSTIYNLHRFYLKHVNNYKIILLQSPVFPLVTDKSGLGYKLFAAFRTFLRSGRCY